MRIGATDSPGVVTFPPLIYVAALVAGFALDLGWPRAYLPQRIQYGVGFAVIALALGLAVAAVLTMRRSGTHIDVRKPATALVTGGPFRLSRNPIYLALTLLYLGIAIASDVFWMFPTLLPALFVMQRGVIAREEAYLADKFGAAYEAYCRSVRRWI
jgi:protein-S-isoprenylcysteine O-methyltransferase Ste14